jgi:hypothetical protein
MFARIATRMQAVLGPITAEVAERFGLIQRQRKFTAETLLQTFLLGFWRKPTASAEDLAVTARHLGVDVSSQAVERRIGPALRDCLCALWHRAVEQVVRARARTVPLLQKFTQVTVGDSTIIRLTDELAAAYPGCGGSSGIGRAALKIQVQWEMRSGELRAALEAGRQHDSTGVLLDREPVPGALSIFDLGYFSLDRFRRWGKANAFWISRAVLHLKVLTDDGDYDLLPWLTQRPEAGVIDGWVTVGHDQPLLCRLIALRAPPEVVAGRRQKAYDKARKKGRRPSRERLAACAWTVFLTNCSETLVTWKEVVVLSRLRWQIELLFVLWKSHHRLAAHRTADPVRQLVELFARRIAVILQHWLLLSSGWDDTRLSLVKAARLIREYLPLVIDALGDRQRLLGVLRQLAGLIARRSRTNRRRKRPSNEQLLNDPELLTYET